MPHHQMERNSSEVTFGELTDDPPFLFESSLQIPDRRIISEQDFSCHCCYDILVDPTTLNCGHNVCRHCLALWWDSSYKNDCPECREKWEGFPKVNILLRDTVDKLFSKEVLRRRAEIKADPNISPSLCAFQRYGDSIGRSTTSQHRGTGFFSGILTALACVSVMLLVYHWSSSKGRKYDLLISKPMSQWSPDEVVSWLEHLGPWTHLYRQPFQHENVNGRLLLMLGDDELSKPPYNMENQAHRRTILAERDQVKALGVKPPQNLWEYKAVNAGKSLFLIYALKISPRLTLFYLYLFDYSETFLPFLHTCCPGIADTDQLEPNWRQWAEFLVKYFLLPYQLIAEFAWNWLTVYDWTSLLIIVNAILLSVLESCNIWGFWTRARIRTLPTRMWSHMWKILTEGFAFALLWPFLPQFVCNCMFYWALYFHPITTIFLIVQQLMQPDTQAH